MLTQVDYELLLERIKKLEKLSEEPRYRFVRDDDCHWYLIPVSMTTAFNNMFANGEDDCWAVFNSTFDDYRCNSPSDYTFTKPE